MTQQQVSQETLVRLARERTLSTVFERAWKERTGVNPVAVAIQMDRRGRGVASCFHEMFLAGILFFSLIGLVTFAASSKDGSTPLAVMVYMLCGVSTVLFGGIASLWLKWFEKNPKITYSGMDEFLADLSALCTWLNPKFSSEAVLLSSNEGVAKFATNSLLVSEAIPLVKLEREKGGDATEMLRRVCEMDLLRKSFTHKYDTLARIGLASGGFDKYFKEAKRLVKKEVKVEVSLSTA